MRRAYQEQKAAGLMSLEELRERPEELEDTHKLARVEADAITAHRERVEDLERDRDALLEELTAMVPDALDALTPEEKNRIYRMLRPSAAPSGFGYEVSGAFCCPEPSRS